MHVHCRQARLNVLCEGQHVKDSPFAPLVEPSEAFAQECTASPPTPIVAGEASHFVVQTRDASGNVKPDGGEQISAKLGDVATATVVDKKDGTYDVTYTSEKAGDFKLAVCHHRQAGESGRAKVDRRRRRHCARRHRQAGHVCGHHARPLRQRVHRGWL